MTQALRRKFQASLDVCLETTSWFLNPCGFIWIFVLHCSDISAQSIILTPTCSVPTNKGVCFITPILMVRKLQNVSGVVPLPAGDLTWLRTKMAFLYHHSSTISTISKLRVLSRYRENRT